MPHKPLTANSLSTAFRAGGDSAAGLDAWARNDFNQATARQTAIWDPLACFLNQVEEIGRWPDGLFYRYVSLTEKPQQP